MLETVLEYGTAKSAALGQFAAGKTGTTSNYGDAWFVGWDSKYTVAVWVGFPNSLVPMTTEFDGGPVLGGTFPALIWHNFMVSAMGVEKHRAEEEAAQRLRRATRAKAPARPQTDARRRLRCRRPRSAAGAGQRRRPAAPAHRRAPAAPPASEQAEKQTAPGAKEAPSAPAAQTPPAAPAGTVDTGTGRPGGLRAGGDPGSERTEGQRGDGRADRRRGAGGLSRAVERQRLAGAAGRETCGLPATRQRHGSSTALVIPTRSPRGSADRARPARAGG